MLGLCKPPKMWVQMGRPSDTLRSASDRIGLICLKGLVMLQSRVGLVSVLMLSGFAASTVSTVSAATVGPGTMFGGAGQQKSYPLGGNDFAAVSFQVQSSFVIQSLDVAMNLSSGSGSFLFTIVTDVPGSATGPDLTATPTASFSLASTAFPLAGTGYALSTVLAPQPPAVLQPGTTYWLVGSGSSNVGGLWRTDAAGNPAGNVVGSFDLFGAAIPYTDTRAPAFLLTGTAPIPLPAASLMGGALILGLLGRRGSVR